MKPYVGAIKILHRHDKLDRVGPVDNRPSINKLHYFVQKKKRKNYM